MRILNSITTAAAALAFLALIPVTAAPTSWTLHDGKTLDAELCGIQNQRVEIKLPNGRRGSLKLSAFSTSSQSRIKQWAQAQGGSLDFASWIKSPDSAFSQPWPKTVYGPNTPTVRQILKDGQAGRYTFESEHYRFVSDEKLDIRTVQQFASLFETTYNYNMKLPINVPGKYRDKNHKFTIYLFGEYENYLRHGGAPRSAGVYLIRRQVILVPLTAVGVYKSGKKWKYLKSKQSSVLSHEITHQLMAGVNEAPWFIEGSAEYIANTRYTHAAFHVYGSQRHIFDSVISKKASKSHTSRKLGPRVVMPSIKAFMNQSYQQFSAAPHTNRNYGISLLLTYYFYHVDGSGNAHNIKNYIKALQRGKTEAEAQQSLLNGRSYETVQKAFSQFCAANGLALEFQ